MLCPKLLRNLFFGPISTAFLVLVLIPTQIHHICCDGALEEEADDDSSGSAAFKKTPRYKLLLEPADGTF